MCGLGGLQEWPEEAIDVWPWGACWLQERWQTADLDAQKKPLMCGFGVAVGCKSGHKKPLMCGLGGLQEWPEEAVDVWPRGGCWLQDEACQVSV